MRQRKAAATMGNDKKPAPPKLPKSMQPEAMAQSVGRYAHAGLMALIHKGVMSGAPIVGFEATPVERNKQEMQQLAVMTLDAERAMVALLTEIFGALIYHPAMAYAFAAGHIIGTSYDWKRLPQEGQTDGSNTEGGKEGTEGQTANTANTADTAKQGSGKGVSTGASSATSRRPSQEHRGANGSATRTRQEHGSHKPSSRSP